MIANASNHSRGPLATGMGQTRMRCTEIIDRTDQIHAMLQRQRVACQRAASTGQRRQTLPKRRIQSLDVRRVDHAVALGPTPEYLHACGRASHDAAFDVDNTPLDISFHDLCDAEVPPRAQPRTPGGPGLDRIAKRLANRPNVRAQPIGTEQEWPTEGTGAYPLDQPPDQSHITL